MTGKLLTIGHSSHSASRFVELLNNHGVTAVCDVRSIPYSRRNPQFNREEIAETLEGHGIRYVFLGKELGARSDDPSCYVDGQAVYERIAATPLYKQGLERVIGGADSYLVALMCAEADPLTCHRTILVCRSLRSPELSIAHILPDGRLERNEEAEKRLMQITKLIQASFFESGNPIERAYEVQAEKIAYTRPAPEGAPHPGEALR